MRPLLRAEKCPTCVFWPGNLMQLAPGRFQDLIGHNRREGTLLICHSDHDRKPADRAMCRGYWDAYADELRVVGIMEAIFGEDWYVEVRRKS